MLDDMVPLPIDQVATLPDTTFTVVPVREAERGVLSDACAVRRIWTVRQGHLVPEWLVIRRHGGQQREAAGPVNADAKVTHQRRS